MHDICKAELVMEGERLMKNIILIGMPGSGKSTVGVVLAKVLGYRFLDSDLLIQEREGRLLSEIMEQEGIDGFIRIEEEINAGICTESCVIATGGSVVYGQKAMEHLGEIGTVVYLSLPLKELEARLGNLRCRGVVLRDGQTLEDLYKERVPLYERYADITVDETGMDVEQTLEMLVSQLRIYK